MSTPAVTTDLDRFRTLAVALIPGAEEATFVPDGDDLASLSFTVPDPRLWTTGEDGTVLPAGRLALALGGLGWTVDNGLDGPVRDDVTTIEIHGPGDGSCASLVSLWEAGSSVFRLFESTDRRSQGVGITLPD